MKGILDSSKDKMGPPRRARRRKYLRRSIPSTTTEAVWVNVREACGKGVRGGQNGRAYQDATGRRLVLSGSGRASRWATRGGVSRLHIALDEEGRHDSAGEVCFSVMAAGRKVCSNLSRLAKESVGPV